MAESVRLTAHPRHVGVRPRVCTETSNLLSRVSILPTREFVACPHSLLSSRLIKRRLCDSALRLLTGNGPLDGALTAPNFIEGKLVSSVFSIHPE